MKSLFIPNYTSQNIPKEFVDSVKSNDKKFIVNMLNSNIINNSKTYYILENGAPTSYIRKIIK